MTLVRHCNPVLVNESKTGFMCGTRVTAKGKAMHPTAIHYLGQVMLHACGFDMDLMFAVCYEPGRTVCT